MKPFYAFINFWLWLTGAIFGYTLSDRRKRLLPDLAREVPYIPILPENWGSVNNGSFSVSSPGNYSKIRNDYILTLENEYICGLGWPEPGQSQPPTLCREISGADLCTKWVKDITVYEAEVCWDHVKRGCLAGFWAITDDFEIDFEVWGHDKPEFRVSAHWGSTNPRKRTTFSYRYPRPEESLTHSIKFGDNYVKVYISGNLIFVFPHKRREKYLLITSVYALIPKLDEVSVLKVFNPTHNGTVVPTVDESYSVMNNIVREKIIK